MSLLAVGLVWPVALAKTATACGVNALFTFSRPAMPLSSRLRVATTYATASTATAVVVGVALSAAGSALDLSRFLPLAAIVCLWAGLNELGLIGPSRMVSSLWQVPARWVADSRTAPLVWGLFLGSGSATQMPHAAYYALLVLVLVLPFPIGIVLMCIYGLVRALPGIAATMTPRCSAAAIGSRMLEFRLLAHVVNGVAAFALVGTLGAIGAAQLLPA